MQVISLPIYPYHININDCISRLDICFPMPCDISARVKIKSTLTIVDVNVKVS